MDKHFQSVALIRHTDKDSNIRWLVKWHEGQKQWNLIRGERLESESFREVIVREVAWELDLERNKEFAVSKMPSLCMEYVGTLPNLSEESHIAVAFYLVPIYQNDVMDKLQRDGLLWVSSGELCNGKTDDGFPIDPLAISWINRWEVVRPWS